MDEVAHSNEVTAEEVEADADQIEAEVGVEAEEEEARIPFETSTTTLVWAISSRTLIALCYLPAALHNIRARY